MQVNRLTSGTAGVDWLTAKIQLHLTHCFGQFDNFADSAFKQVWNAQCCMLCLGVGKESSIFVFIGLNILKMSFTTFLSFSPGR